MWVWVFLYFFKRLTGGRSGTGLTRLVPSFPHVIGAAAHLLGHVEGELVLTSIVEVAVADTLPHVCNVTRKQLWVWLKIIKYISFSHSFPYGGIRAVCEPKMGKLAGGQHKILRLVFGQKKIQMSKTVCYSKINLVMFSFKCSVF